MYSDNEKWLFERVLSLDVPDAAKKCIHHSIQVNSYVYNETHYATALETVVPISHIPKLPVSRSRRK